MLAVSPPAPAPAARGRLVAVLLTLTALLLTAAACGGSQAAKQPPAKRLAAAKRALDHTPAVHITLDGSQLPASASGLMKADGTATHQPAFKGTIRVVDNGLALSLPIVAVDGKVLVKFGHWQPVDPSQYNAPDPSGLMAKDHGLSSLLTSAQKLSAGKERRSGRDVVTDISATVPGAQMASIVPSAAKAPFKAVFTVDDSNQLVQARLTGRFYPDAGPVTYTFAFDGYGANTTVKAP